MCVEVIIAFVLCWSIKIQHWLSLNSIIAAVYTLQAVADLKVGEGGRRLTPMPTLVDLGLWTLDIH